MLFQYLYTFSSFSAESWLCNMLRSVLFLPKNVNDFFRLNLDFCEFARMRFHCASGQVVLHSCATERCVVRFTPQHETYCHRIQRMLHINNILQEKMFQRIYTNSDKHEHWKTLFMVLLYSHICCISIFKRESNNTPYKNFNKNRHPNLNKNRNKN